METTVLESTVTVAQMENLESRKQLEQQGQRKSFLILNFP